MMWLPPPANANMFSHIDFILTKKTESIVLKVDVKSRKRTSRKDKQFNDDWIWLEFRNVQGKNGWMKGDSTHIAFEREKEFVLVPRLDLYKWAKKEIIKRYGNGKSMSIKCVAKNSRDSKYKCYTRHGRQDLLTQVNYEEMLKGINNIEIWSK